MSSLLSLIFFIGVIGAIIAFAVALLRAIGSATRTANRALSIPEKFIEALPGIASSAAGAVAAVAAAPRARSYRYERKQFLLTRSERAFFDALTRAVGERYYVFAQVRLSGLLDEKIKGQSWRGALGKVNQKSVDFVLCDRTYVSPVLAIELDDKTHARADRRERDRVVEDILEDAGLPLLRWRVGTDFDPGNIAATIDEAIKGAGR